MALPPDFAKSTADEIFDRTILSAEAVFMKPLPWNPSRRGPSYDRESYLKCGAALVGKFALTRDLEFAEAALQRLHEVLTRDNEDNAQVLLYKSIISTLDGVLRWKDESHDFHLYRLHCFVESRCDIQRAINLENGSHFEELYRRCEDIILRVQKAVLKDRNHTESIRSIWNYLSSKDEQLDETAMVDFEDLVQRLRKVAVLYRENRLEHMVRKFSLCHYDSDGEERHPLQAVVTGMVIMQGTATPKDGPVKDGGKSCASSADGEENSVEKTIGELLDFTQFVIFEHFQRSAEEMNANDHRNPAEIFTMLGAAWLGKSLLGKSIEDAIYSLNFALLKLQYALNKAPGKPDDASFYFAKALEAINLYKCDITEENKKVAVNRKRKLGAMEYQISGGDT